MLVVCGDKSSNDWSLTTNFTVFNSGFFSFCSLFCLSSCYWLTTLVGAPQDFMELKTAETAVCLGCSEAAKVSFWLCAFVAFFNSLQLRSLIEGLVYELIKGILMDEGS